MLLQFCLRQNRPQAASRSEVQDTAPRGCLQPRHCEGHGKSRDLALRPTLVCDACNPVHSQICL